MTGSSPASEKATSGAELDLWLAASIIKEFLTAVKGGGFKKRGPPVLIKKKEKEAVTSTDYFSSLAAMIFPRLILKETNGDGNILRALVLVGAAKF